MHVNFSMDRLDKLTVLWPIKYGTEQTKKFQNGKKNII